MVEKLIDKMIGVLKKFALNVILGPFLGHTRDTVQWKILIKTVNI